MKAILALQDGRIFTGESFGAVGSVTGEICFNTSMTGYQEVLTDPSYRGQIVSMTYPLIGNYGVNPEDAESSQPHVRGFVIEELCEVPSNWRSQESLDSYLKRHNVLGIQGIDTRALTKHLRSLGSMQACLTTELDEQQAVEAARNAPSMEGSDFVKEVTTSKPYRWDRESREWTLVNPSTGVTGNYLELPPIKYRVVAYDFGVKWNILRGLRQALRSRTITQAGWQVAGIRYLSWSPVAVSRFWRQDLQVEVRSPRRQPAGQGPAQRQGGHHLAKPRFCGRSCQFAG